MAVIVDAVVVVVGFRHLSQASWQRHMEVSAMHHYLLHDAELRCV